MKNAEELNRIARDKQKKSALENTLDRMEEVAEMGSMSFEFLLDPDDKEVIPGLGSMGYLIIHDKSYGPGLRKVMVSWQHYN